MASATLTSKGQVTIPKEIRDYLHLYPGDQIDYVVEKNGTVTIHAATINVMQLKGILKSKISKAVSIKDMEDAIVKGATGAKR